MSKAILITSYYRSGTSALAGTLNLAGVDIVNTTEQNEHNPRGYFENPMLVKLDIEIFKRLERQWHDIRLMPDTWWERPDVGAEAQGIVTEMRNRHEASPLWAIKHPHLCRLLPVYEDAARRVSGESPHVIHIYRDPWVVAHSQFKKNGLSRAHALLLWTSYVLDGERYARHLNRVVLDYDLLVKDTPQALKRIGSGLGVDFPRRSPQDLAHISRFLTPHLRRSRPQGREHTPAALRRLVEDVWDAALGEAEAEKFEQLRERFLDQCLLIDELASSKLAVTARLNLDNRIKPAGESNAQQSDIEGSPLRPSERTDKAEKRRLLKALEQRNNPPDVSIVISVPAGRVAAAFETAESLRRQWLGPRSICYLCADQDAPQREDWIQVNNEPGALTRAVAERVNAQETDYVAVIDAGDRIEPDACARLCLFAADNGRPALMYTDEIVANAQDPWIRHKPDFDIERLRGLHYLGGWLWYKTAFLQNTASLEGNLPGAEDFDYALRVHEAGQKAVRLAEALYARAPDSYRDTTSADAVRDNARQVLTGHLERSGVLERIELADNLLPGSFTLRHGPVPDKRISLVLLCNEAGPEHVSDLAPQRLEQALEALNIDHIVCAASSHQADAEIHGALKTLHANNPAPDQLHVITADSEAKMLGEIAAHVGPDAVIMLSLDANTSDAHWLGHLQGKLYGQDQSVGMVGASADYPSNGSTRLLGPLLLGGNEGVGIIGLGREAGDPGPGGWLLTPQNVDGVAPPCLAIRGEVLKQVSPDEQLAGAALWLDLSLQVRSKGYQVIWDPSVRVSCSHPPAYTTFSSEHYITGNRLLRQRWGCRSQHHHPMLALQGDNLTPVGKAGLCAGVPRGDAHTLLSGPIEGSEYAVECLRMARMETPMTAGWAPEPLAITEMQRLRAQAWMRINPETAVTAPDAPAWQALFTRPPAHTASLKAIAEQAQRCLATSPVLAEALRKMSYNRLQPEVIVPKLPGRIWRDFHSHESVGREKVRVLWVDEGEPPSWMVDLLNLKDLQWFVIENDRRHYDGQIVTFKCPTDETGWYSIFRDVAPHVLIRPAQDATWMDCQLLLRGAAAGTALLADSRLNWPEALPVTALSSRFDDWRRALERLKEDPEGLAERGRRTRDALDQVGWLEDEDVFDMFSVTSPAKRIGQAV